MVIFLTNSLSFDYLQIKSLSLPKKSQHISFTFLAQIFLCGLLFMASPAFSQTSQIKNGVNIQASYYNGGRVNIGWELMKEYPEIEAVRIEIEPALAHQAISWIREAHENGYQVIATYHDATKLGSDDTQELLNAAHWWEDNYNNLSSSGPIIINLMNEWGSHTISPAEYAAAYNEAIDIIRPFYSGKIIVDVPGWGQATKIAADAYPLFDDQNITYSIHIYTSAFNVEQKRWLAHEDLAYLDATGADCMVGEFCDTATGGADWCTIIDNCFANEWPLFGWAWNGDGRNMNMTEPHWRDQPRANEFRPTEFMKVITDKLKGIPCYTQADEDCTGDMIGERCEDKNPYTVNDRFNEYCHCVGHFNSNLQFKNTTQKELIIYPNPVESNQEISIELFQINAFGHLQIYNSIGENIISVPTTFHQERININTERFIPGVYWVSFQDGEDIRLAKAFVVY